MALSGVAVSDRIGENGNTRRVAPPWWEQEHGDRVGVYNCSTHGGALTSTQLGARLSAQVKRTLVAVHEAAHVAAIHGLGLAVGTAELLVDSPEALGEDGVLTRRGKTGYAELEPHAGSEMATIALAGWVASELWLNERELADDRTMSYIQLDVIDDHHWLLNIPTIEPTAYLYGSAPAPKGWLRQVSIDETLASTTALVASRWIDVLKLSRALRQDGVLSPETTDTILGDRGWAR